MCCDLSTALTCHLIYARCSLCNQVKRYLFCNDTETVTIKADNVKVSQRSPSRNF